MFRLPMHYHRWANDLTDIHGGSGPPSALFISSDIDKPIPGPGEALVKIRFFGINRMDLTQRKGLYQVPPHAGHILGAEFSGVIEELVSETNGNSTFQVGDEVFGLGYGGAYAEYIAVSTRMLIEKPSSLSWEVAAGIPETWITAMHAMFLLGKFEPGQSILWHAGASSVSLAGLQLSAAHGASAVYATAGSTEKIELCKSLGATHGWNYKAEDWEAELNAVTQGKGVDIVVDFVGQQYFQKNLNSLANNGRLLIVGLLSGNRVESGVDLFPFVLRHIKVEGSRIRSMDLDYQGKRRDLLVQEALPKLSDGTFKVPIEKVFDWKDIQLAHELMESNTIRGKIVCQVV
jgi:NADPH:quinone reductase-like Zn-dependent oxidoreductase